MGLLELGGLAVATLTLVSKMVRLITVIQNLILRLDAMQREIELGYNERALMQTTLSNQGCRLLEVETVLPEIREDISDIKTSVKELIHYVFRQ